MTTTEHTRTAHPARPSRRNHRRGATLLATAGIVATLGFSLVGCSHDSDEADSGSHSMSMPVSSTAPSSATPVDTRPAPELCEPTNATTGPGLGQAMGGTESMITLKVTGTYMLPARVLAPLHVTGVGPNGPLGQVVMLALDATHVGIYSSARGAAPWNKVVVDVSDPNAAKLGPVTDGDGTDKNYPGVCPRAASVLNALGGDYLSLTGKPVPGATHDNSTDTTWVWSTLPDTKDHSSLWLVAGDCLVRATAVYVNSADDH